MSKEMQEDRLRSRIDAIYQFHHENGRMPSYSETGKMLGLKSKNAVFKLVSKLEEMKAIERDDTGRLIPRLPAPSLRIIGTVEAGFPSPAEEELADAISLDELLVRNKAATFLLKVSGDSMTEAGILPGDMVIIDRNLSPKSGDIVIAEVDGEWTMKYLKKRGEMVVLVPGNKKYKPIRPKNELKIAGVVTAVIRQYK